VAGQPYPMRGTVTQAIEDEGIRGEAGRTATGGAVDAIIGGLLGGGGTIAATEGNEVKLLKSTQLRVRIDSHLVIDFQ
jgi:hypothetical protein